VLQKSAIRSQRLWGKNKYQEDYGGSLIVAGMEVSKQQIQTTMTQGIRSFATAHATGGEAWVQVRNREVSS